MVYLADPVWAASWVANHPQDKAFARTNGGTVVEPR